MLVILHPAIMFQKTTKNKMPEPEREGVDAVRKNKGNPGEKKK